MGVGAEYFVNIYTIIYNALFELLADLLIGVDKGRMKAIDIRMPF